jgi:hypothetical protein
MVPAHHEKLGDVEVVGIIGRRRVPRDQHEANGLTPAANEKWESTFGL